MLELMIYWYKKGGDNDQIVDNYAINNDFGLEIVEEATFVLDWFSF